ncbi:hypothetical protein B9G54_05160 [Alloscardovia macacae]|uniref:Fido domain-containing protein n=1 Tax=Alloscardovia macacae TaxID=1160091 RepID=A0A1Y2SX31_9BIFI|nr:Fic family protein [Alloscardovia macacae]OTA26371.1 hypothetical protein B9G54_05160 [Alloscardovia macacae]OTA28823.1 hypothetical protein B9T39_05720 [Alloscardovia macacae]
MSIHPLLHTLRSQKREHISGGLYESLLYRMTYHSNRIEGCLLDPNTVRGILTRGVVQASEPVRVSDVLETCGHARALTYCIDTAEESLTDEYILHLHALLKMGQEDSGVYKTRRNVIGMTMTSDPKDVPAHMHTLLTEYTALSSPTFEDIVDFHYRFERIHPFQDGNGRVGRLIAFKECLRAGIVPFFIADTKKHFYYRGLHEYPTQPGFLRETCADGQDTVRALMTHFEVPEK